MVKDSTMKWIRLLGSIILAIGIAYGLLYYYNIEPWYYAVGGGLFFGILFYLISTERKIPASAVKVLRYIIMLVVAGFFGYYWYTQSGKIEEAIGLFLVGLIALYILLIKGLKKGGKEEE